MSIKRGDIYYADLSPVVGSEQGGIRPVLIVQNDVGNKFSPTVIAAAITSQRFKTTLPTHIQVNADNCGLTKDSIVLLEQVRTIDKRRLKERMGNLTQNDMRKINKGLTVSFGLLSGYNETWEIHKLHFLKLYKNKKRAESTARFLFYLICNYHMNLASRFLSGIPIAVTAIILMLSASKNGITHEERAATKPICCWYINQAVPSA